MVTCYTPELNRILLQGTNFFVFTFQGFNPLFEYRDLSAWRVNISKVATHRDVNGKNSFFFVIEVQRCGSSDQTPNPESKNSEFFPRNGMGFFNELIFFIWTLFLPILILKQKIIFSRSKETFPISDPYFLSKFDATDLSILIDFLGPRKRLEKIITDYL